MAGFKVCFRPEANILGEDGATFGLGLPFLGILEPSSFSSIATVSVYYEAGLSGLVFLWLLATLSRTSVARQRGGPREQILNFCSQSLQRSRMHLII